MNEFHQYLAEEVALDMNDGLISRREALLRLRGLGIGVAAATTMLGCSSDDDTDNSQSTSEPNLPEGNNPAPAPTTSATTMTGMQPGAMTEPVTPSQVEPGNTPVTMEPTPAEPEPVEPEPVEPEPMEPAQPGAPVPTQEITFAGPQGTLMAAFAPAATPRGAVLVIHENRGLNDHIRSVAGRLAGAGYSALALDLLSEEGGSAVVGATNAPGRFGTIPTSRFVADMQAALGELARRTPNAKLGAIGFCFGGGMMWSLLAAKDPRLAAAAPFYGPLPAGANFVGASTAVVAFYGSLDARVNMTRDAADQALTQAGLTHEMVTYEGANHAFFNDTGGAYNASAATQAYAKLLEWFGEHLA